MKRIADNITGFSLIEAIVSIAIFSLITLGIVALVPFIFSSADSQTKLLSNNDQAMHVAFGIMKELRNAKTSANGAYAFNTTNDQQLIFYCNCGTTVDRINYYIQSGVLKKGITKPTGSPPVYNLGQEVVTTIQNDVSNGSNPLFYYYNDTYNGVSGTALAQPVNVTQVKFIKINLSIYNKGGRTGNTNSYTVSAGGAIRNLKNNLGN
ncbi:MAG TPA: prepilin-type N-terminal cleavage/methylation domain-containing protein [Patescibacteria group bacterium]